MCYIGWDEMWKSLYHWHCCSLSRGWSPGTPIVRRFRANDALAGEDKRLLKCTVHVYTLHMYIHCISCWFIANDWNINIVIYCDYHKWKNKLLYNIHYIVIQNKQCPTSLRLLQDYHIQTWKLAFLLVHIHTGKYMEPQLLQNNAWQSLAIFAFTWHR